MMDIEGKVSRKGIVLIAAVAALFTLSSFAMWAGAAVPASASTVATIQDAEFEPNPAAGLGFIVHTKFGGYILGYDIDQSGSEGVLSEYVSEGGGKNLVATETFSQETGNIVKVVAKKDQTQDDYATQGIVGSHVGLVLYQHVVGGNVRNHFLTMNPLTLNKFTGKWTPQVKKDYILWSISHTQGTANVAVLETSLQAKIYAYLFSSNVAANTFGPQVAFNDSNIGIPLLAFDSKANQAVLAGDTGSPTTHPILATVDLTKGKVREFHGLGVGLTNGLAVDSATGTACITTEGGPFTPPMVEFYDLAKQTGFGVTLPGSNIGGDVEFDPIHKLFLVSAGEGSNSSIVVFDEKGNLKETINGFNLPASPSLIALHPGKRLGFVLGDRFATTLQSFTY